ncbi:SDR family oxidoreductase [Brenneria izadpanahii]|uniref:SDR family oxidoreductase n=1 Tax=Brenneria izadpanahii TaxID=2722756 RepID=A0ABX7USG7_9GAMM|nr:SDR family oxidoreductase [Brenneria izadpanahii]QTF08676.1 SDR family oxidoreductase [Brenneria izadpanahii]
MSEQHIVIVGGSSGIGLAAAKRFAGAGFQVTIGGRNASRLAQAAVWLDNKAKTCVLDAADPAAVKETFAKIGAFDHLVLAFGSTSGGGAFDSVDMNDVRAGFEEKVFPHFSTAQAALPFLAQRGSITFIAAVTAHAAMPGTAGIGAANAAVAALVPILAAELKPRRVNGVSPGVIDTPWWNFLSDEQKAPIFAEYAAKTPVGRVGSADDIADAVYFLVGNAFMSGEVVICDGGLRLGS